MNYSDIIAQNQRLSILQILATQSDYQTNAAIVQSALKTLGLSASFSQVKTQLNWLAEQGFITVDFVVELPLAKITHAGLDIAQGFASHPDIAKIAL